MIPQLGTTNLIARAFVTQRLAARPEITARIGNPPRIYADAAPLTAQFPCIIVADLFQPADLALVNAVRIKSTLDLKVVAAGPAPSDLALAPLQAAIDEALHRTKGFVSVAHDGETFAGQVMSCVRFREYRLAEFINETRHLQLGGVYRVEVQTA